MSTPTTPPPGGWPALLRREAEWASEEYAAHLRALADALEPMVRLADDYALPHASSCAARRGYGEACDCDVGPVVTFLASLAPPVE